MFCHLCVCLLFFQSTGVSCFLQGRQDFFNGGKIFKAVTKNQSAHSTNIYYVSTVCQVLQYMWKEEQMDKSSINGRGKMIP